MSGRRDLASILEDIASELRRANDLAGEASDYVLPPPFFFTDNQKNRWI